MQNKIEKLYQFYLQNGFDHTVDEIITALEISRKTFFNRYISKNQSVTLCVDYWHEVLRSRLQRKLLQCNHSVEELVMFGWEMHSIRQNELCYLNYEMANGTLLTSDAPFMSILQSILSKGTRCYHFREDVNKELFSKYLINILTKMEFAESEHPQIMRYVLAPLLTERGVELLEEVEI